MRQDHGGFFLSGSREGAFLKARAAGLALSAISLVGCSDSFFNTQLQFESFDPSGRGGVGPISVQHITSDIRVRLFPILTVPAGEPYPISKNLFEVFLNNSKKIKIYDGSTLVAEATSIQVSVKAEKIRLDVGRRGSLRELPLKKYIFMAADKSNPTLVSWDLKVDESTVLSFRGQFSLEPTYFSERREFLWSLINDVDVEDYLYSVVPSEVPSYWHPTALEVQAIAARSYAIRQMVLARRDGQPWDVDPTTMYQSYRGSGKEQKATTGAVENTRGQVLVYQNGVIEASFSSHSGGITCAANECFQKVEDVAYLQSRSDAIEMETRQVDKVGTWEACTTPELIQYHLARYEFLGAKVPEFAAPTLNGQTPLEVCHNKNFRDKVHSDLDPRLQVKAVNPFKVTAAQRLWSLDLELADERELSLDRDETKMHGRPYLPSLRTPMFGRRSYLMKVRSVTGDGVYVIEGHGFGHGVGMSQYGAQWRAEKYKQSVEQILKFYYSGVEIIRLNLKELP